MPAPAVVAGKALLGSKSGRKLLKAAAGAGAGLLLLPVFVALFAGAILGGAGVAQAATVSYPPIQGPSDLTANDIVHWWNQQNYPDPSTTIHLSIEKLAAAYINDGKIQQITGDIAFAQAVEETGGFASSDATQLYNFAGIGASDTNPHPVKYPDATTGVMGHIELLVKASGGKVVPPDVSGTSWGGKIAVTWGDLSSNWASDPSYVLKIMRIYNSMRAAAGIPPVSTTTTVTGNASTQAIAAAATQLDAMNLPYVWGGGHTGTPAVPSGSALASTGQPGKPGLDCSGAVSWVLQHGGFNVQTMVSGGFETVGQPATSSTKGVLIWASASHVFLTVNGRIFSSNTDSRPDGGPHWKGTFTNVSQLWVYEPQEAYVIRHVPGTT